MPRLVVFDIDGTLTDTNHVDDECFRAAVADVFALDAAPLDWSHAPHVTDEALARWLSERYRGRPPDRDELSRLVARFVELLRLELRRAPGRFLPIRGAPGLFAQLSEAGWHIALATGGWLPSARLKLETAGLLEPAIPMASASDAGTRTGIVRLACRKAAEHYGCAFDRIVCVGDALWDAEAAAALGYGFVGVGRSADALRQAGTTLLLADYTDRAAVGAALEAASLAPARTEP